MQLATFRHGSEGARERAAADEAAFALLALGARIAALADVDWHSPAAVLYRVSIGALRAECDALRLRLDAYIPPEP